MSDASYGVVTVGRLILREAFTIKSDVHAGNGIRTITIEGEESSPPLTFAMLMQRTEDIMTMRDLTIPITFERKSDWDGLYLVTDTSTEHTDYVQSVRKTAWSIRARRIGPSNATEVESRLTGLTRQNDFGKTGLLWHAPSPGHYGYYTGSTRPTAYIDRPSEDGNVRTYLGIPDFVSPRWSVTATNLRKGRARLKVDGFERTGTNMKDGTSWELGNGIIRVTPAANGGLVLGVWNGSSYESKNYNISVGSSATAVGDYNAMTVLRNDFEMVTIRLVKDHNPGRAFLDLSIRRGARFVEGYLETDVSTTLGVGLAAAENATAPASGGYVVASANDSDGNRAIVGTAKSFVPQTGRTGIHKTSTVRLDFFIGSVYGGSDAATGDAAADLANQYIGSLAEMTMAVMR